MRLLWVALLVVTGEASATSMRFRVVRGSDVEEEELFLSGATKAELRIRSSESVAIIGEDVVAATRSVKFRLFGDDVLVHERIEKVAPFAVFGDFPAGNFTFADSTFFVPGVSYVLGAEEYAGKGASGDLLRTTTVSFRTLLCVDAVLRDGFGDGWGEDSYTISESLFDPDDDGRGYLADDGDFAFLDDDEVEEFGVFKQTGTLRGGFEKTEEVCFPRETCYFAVVSNEERVAYENSLDLDHGAVVAGGDFEEPRPFFVSAKAGVRAGCDGATPPEKICLPLGLRSAEAGGWKGAFLEIFDPATLEVLARRDIASWSYDEDSEVCLAKKEGPRCLGIRVDFSDFDGNVIFWTLGDKKSGIRGGSGDVSHFHLSGRRRDLAEG